MKHFIVLLVLILVGNSITFAQNSPMRMIISSGMGKSCTTGGVIIGYSPSIANKLWQGFWIPKNVTTGIKKENVSQTAASTITPNPANSVFTIVSNKEIENVLVYSITGEIFYRGNAKQIIVAGLSSDVYIVRVTYKDNTNDIHKLIISH